MKIEIEPDALIMLIGASASGKSTFARNHFDREDMIESDHCRALVCGDETRQDINREAFTLFHRIIDTRMKLGVFTVADATNLVPKDRKSVYMIAERHNRPIHNLLFEAPLDVLRANNGGRDRQVPDFVLEKHLARFNGVGGMDAAIKEQESVYLQYPYDNVTIVKRPILNMHDVDSDQEWWVIGDVHGCFVELSLLVDMIPEKDRIAFVGDFIDRGPFPQESLNMVEGMIASGRAVASKGNHDDKAHRGAVLGRNIKPSQMLTRTLESVTPKDLKFIGDLPLQVHLTHPNNPGTVVSVVHGALRYGDRGMEHLQPVKAMALYGETDGTKLVNGFPNRTYEWVDTWDGKWPEAICVYGHATVDEILWNGVDGNVVNIDTACAFGGKLTAYNPFTGEYKEVAATRDYSKDGQDV